MWVTSVNTKKSTIISFYMLVILIEGWVHFNGEDGGLSDGNALVCVYEKVSTVELSYLMRYNKNKN